MEAEFGFKMGIIWISGCRKWSGRPEHKNKSCFPIFYVPLEMLLIVSCSCQTVPSPRESRPSARICFSCVTPAIQSCAPRKNHLCFLSENNMKQINFFLGVSQANPGCYISQKMACTISMSICNPKQSKISSIPLLIN